MTGHVLGIVAAVLQVCGYLLYIRNFRNKSILPNAASFLMFAYGTAFIFFLEWQSSASWPMLALPGACALMSVIIALMCLRRGATEPIDQVEGVTFALDVGLTLGYAYGLFVFGANPAFAVGFLLAGNVTTLTAFFPLVRSTYAWPKRELPGPWVVWTIAYASLTAATIADGGLARPVLLVYPVLNLLLHGLLVGLAMRRQGPGDRFSDGSSVVFNRPSPIHGIGLIAGRAFNKGERIWTMRGHPVSGSLPETHPNAVGFAHDLWIEPEPPFHRVNHSCDPNAAFGQFGEFYALRPIARDEEITMDYSTTESDPLWEMDCACQASNCRKQLRAIQIAFEHSPFPPPASPGMQMIWRTQRRAVHQRLAFPQLGPAADRSVAPVRGPIADPLTGETKSSVPK